MAILYLLIGLILIAAGLYVYFVAHVIYPNSDSSRVHDMNWLLRYLGKTGVTILFSSIGLIYVILGIRKFK